MIAIFFGSMFAGHLYIIMIVTAVQIISFKEVIAIAHVPSKDRNLNFTKTLNWYFLGSTMYFLYGESVIYYFKHIVLVDRVLLPFATHHRFISFMLYVIGKSQDIWHTWIRTWLTFLGLRLLCRLPAEGPLQVPIHPVRLDAYGPLPHRGTSAFYHEQHIRGHDLVLPARVTCHHQRHLCIHMRHHLRPNTAHQVIAKEDCGGFPWCMGLHDYLRRPLNQCPYEVQVLHLSRQRKPHRLTSEVYTI